MSPDGAQCPLTEKPGLAEGGTLEREGSGLLLPGGGVRRAGGRGQGWGTPPAPLAGEGTPGWQFISQSVIGNTVTG